MRNIYDLVVTTVYGETYTYKIDGKTKMPIALIDQFTAQFSSYEELYRKIARQHGDIKYQLSGKILDVKIRYYYTKNKDEKNGKKTAHYLEPVLADDEALNNITNIFADSIKNGNSQEKTAEILMNNKEFDQEVDLLVNLYAYNKEFRKLVEVHMLDKGAIFFAKSMFKSMPEKDCDFIKQQIMYRLATNYRTYRDYILLLHSIQKQTTKQINVSREQAVLDFYRAKIKKSYPYRLNEEKFNNLKRFNIDDENYLEELKKVIPSMHLMDVMLEKINHSGETTIFQENEKPDSKQPSLF